MIKQIFVVSLMIVCANNGFASQQMSFSQVIGNTSKTPITQTISNANYDKMKNLYDNAKQTPTLSDFDWIHQGMLHPLHCVGYRSDSSDSMLTYPRVAQRTVAPATPSQGPLIPSQPAKVETKLIASGISMGDDVIAKKQDLWDAFTNKYSATDLILYKNVPLKGDTWQSETDFRKNGGYITFKNVEAAPVYGYCFRLTQETWAATADARVYEGHGNYFVQAGFSLGDDKITAEKRALDSCEKESAGMICTVKSVENGCITTVYDGARNFYQGTGHDSTDAMSQSLDEALRLCLSHGSGCKVFNAYCSDGEGYVPSAK